MLLSAKLAVSNIFSIAAHSPVLDFVFRNSIFAYKPTHSMGQSFPPFYLESQESVIVGIGRHSKPCLTNVNAHLCFMELTVEVGYLYQCELSQQQCRLKFLDFIQQFFASVLKQNGAIHSRILLCSHMLHIKNFDRWVLYVEDAY